MTEQTEKQAGLSSDVSLTSGPGPTVLAIVLTYNAPGALRACLTAISSQTRSVDGILIVDNASETPAEMVVADLQSQLCVKPNILCEAKNLGPGGGYAHALEHFKSSSFDLAWILDDDALPDADCLEHLHAESAASGNRTYLLPMWVQPDGEVTRFTAWCGVLIARSIVEEVGVPRADYFWWAEDTEYLMWRIPQAGYPVRHCDEAIVHHAKVRDSWGNPPWKYYYEVRNTIHYDVWVRHRVKRLPRKLTLIVARVLFRESGGRLKRLHMILRGTVDGLCVRLGQRVIPSTTPIPDGKVVA